ncbi:hypothetical protein [Streptomyces collinus]|uniref:hypothetical protein n=1 Tax=Streptomyces collinus TaxID=42684 RepID=UPI0036B6B79D
MVWMSQGGGVSRRKVRVSTGGGPTPGSAEFLQAVQVGLVDQGAGEVVAEGVAGTLLETDAAEGDSGQEAGVAAEAFGVAGGDSAVKQLASPVADELAAQDAQFDGGTAQLSEVQPLTEMVQEQSRSHR